MNLSSMTNPVKVGEHGYIRLTRIMAEIDEDGGLTPVGDISSVNDAKATFNKRSEIFGDKEALILEKLHEGNHTSPFRGTIFQFEICAPLMVIRQWYKYAVGSDHDESGSLRDPFFSWNEVSRRYITRKPFLYSPGPDGWRKAPEERRQGSAGPLEAADGVLWEERLRAYQEQGASLYMQAVGSGVAPEQARLFLAAYGLYVTARWTCSLQAVCHLLNQRLNHDAQGEFQAFARPVYDFVHALTPEATNALLRPEIRDLMEDRPVPEKWV